MKIIEVCPKCGHDLNDLVLTTYPPIPQKECFNCGWSWTGKREEVVRVPFGDNSLIGKADCLNSDSNDYIAKDCTELNNDIPFTYTTTTINDIKIDHNTIVGGYNANPCENCSNNPKNGGSGICNCTLGLPKITC